MSEHIVADRQEPCWHCGQPTHFIEIDFKAFLCPGPCSQAKVQEFWDALRGVGPTEWLEVKLTDMGIEVPKRSGSTHA